MGLSFGCLGVAGQRFRVPEVVVVGVVLQHDPHPVNSGVAAGVPLSTAARAGAGRGAGGDPQQHLAVAEEHVLAAPAGDVDVGEFPSCDGHEVWLPVEVVGVRGHRVGLVVLPAAAAAGADAVRVGVPARRQAGRGAADVDRSGRDPPVVQVAEHSDPPRRESARPRQRPSSGVRGRATPEEVSHALRSSPVFPGRCPMSAFEVPNIAVAVAPQKISSRKNCLSGVTGRDVSAGNAVTASDSNQSSPASAVGRPAAFNWGWNEADDTSSTS
jgi:hypothetical protein